MAKAGCRVVIVLLVEDEPDHVDRIRNAVSDLDLDITVTSSKDAALREIRAKHFDLVICDLHIPSSDGGLDHSKDHGDLVRVELLENAPGVPVIVHSGRGKVPDLTRFLREGRRADYFGTGEQDLLFDYVEKDDLPDLVRRVRKHSEHHKALGDIEVIPQLPDPLDERALAIYSRRQGGHQAIVTPLGGLSEARVYRLTVKSDQGASKADVVARIDNLESVNRELDLYHEHIVPLITLGGFAPLAGWVVAGAGARGALFYSVAATWDRTLTEIVIQQPDEAASVVPKLGEITKRWLEDAPQEVMRIGEVRRLLLPDEKVAGLEHLAEPTRRIGFEERSVPVTRCVQHRDLHGDNVLVDPSLVAVLIDFAAVGPGVGCLDPVVLELSTIFHPALASNRGAWPTIDQAQEWSNLDAFAAGCPFEPFIRACRDWAETTRRGPREALAVVYSYALRQLRYDDTPKDIACGLIDAAIDGWG